MKILNVIKLALSPVKNIVVYINKKNKNKKIIFK